MSRPRAANSRQLTLLVLGCSLAYLATSGPTARAANSKSDATAYTITTQGSTTTHRAELDIASGYVYIYVGGAFPAGTHLVDFKFLFDQGSTSAYLTPLLFEQTSVGIYTVRAIGKGAVVIPDNSPQTIAFTTLEGPKLTLNKHYTFGFINAIVDLGGFPLLTSPGAVDFDTPDDAGLGTGGPGTTNGWGATYTGGPITVTIGIRCFRC